MSDSIKRTGGPGSSDDVATRPDVGFHDDHVGGHIKAEEAAKRRAALGVMQRRPKRIEVEPQQVAQVARNRGADKDRAEKEANRQQQGLVRGKGPPRAKPQQADVAMHAVDQDVRRIEDRVDLLMANLAKLEMQRLAAASQQGRRPGEVDGQVLALVAAQQGADEPNAAGANEADEVTRTQHRIVEGLTDEDGRRGGQKQDAPDERAEEAEEAGPVDEATAAARWEHTARDMRFLLQHLIAGGVGLAVCADPATTFKRVFDGLQQWPQKVPPGRRPVDDADYDLFLAWVFRPEVDQADFQALTQAVQAAADAGAPPG